MPTTPSPGQRQPRRVPSNSPCPPWGGVKLWAGGFGSCELLSVRPCSTDDLYTQYTQTRLLGTAWSQTHSPPPPYTEPPRTLRADLEDERCLFSWLRGLLGDRPLPISRAASCTRRMTTSFFCACSWQIVDSTATCALRISTGCKHLQHWLLFVQCSQTGAPHVHRFCNLSLGRGPSPHALQCSPASRRSSRLLPLFP